VPTFGPAAAVPPLRAYEHAGELKYIAANGGIRDRPSWWERLKDGFRGRYDHLIDTKQQLQRDWTLQLPDKGFIDHAPLYYALRIWNAYVDR
jgi:hypothetical protein